MPTATTRRAYLKPSRPLSGARLTRVRCLGPAKREHTFLSPGVDVRVCPACRRVQNQLSLARCEFVARDPGFASL